VEAIEGAIGLPIAVSDVAGRRDLDGVLFLVDETSQTSGRRRARRPPAITQVSQRIGGPGDGKYPR
jgi:hypothetical protein